MHHKTKTNSSQRENQSDDTHIKKDIKTKNAPFW